MSKPSFQWKSKEIRQLMELALNEDQAFHDKTSELLFPANLKIEICIRAKQSGVVCGLPLALTVFQTVDSKATGILQVKEGAQVKVGQKLLSVKGKAIRLLAAERTALNFIQHLSGIASWTRQHVGLLKKGSARLYDTRKTIPGFRALQKYAVACGGGTNHRMSLNDAILIKENHLKIARLANIPWALKVHTFQKKSPHEPIELEIQTREDLETALMLGPKRVLLDNLSDKTLRQFIARLRQRYPKIEIEVSGGVRGQDLSRLSRLPIQRISMGALTHSAPSFDCSLDIERVIH